MKKLWKYFNNFYLYVLAVPLLFILLGDASNFLVLITNHQKFPVMENEFATQHLKTIYAEKLCVGLVDETAADGGPEFQACMKTNGNSQFIDDTHSLMGKNSHLKALSDIFDIGFGIASVGDGLVWLGEALWGFAPVVWIVLILRRLWDLTTAHEM